MSALNLHIHGLLNQTHLTHATSSAAARVNNTMKHVLSINKIVVLILPEQCEVSDGAEHPGACDSGIWNLASAQ